MAVPQEAWAVTTDQESGGVLLPLDGCSDKVLVQFIFTHVYTLRSCGLPTHMYGFV